MKNDMTNDQKFWLAVVFCITAILVTLINDAFNYCSSVQKAAIAAGLVQKPNVTYTTHWEKP